MAVVLVGSGANERWRAHLREALGEPVGLAHEPGAAQAMRVAVVAGVLSDSLAAAAELELVVTVRAGVDDLIAPGRVPAHVPIVRAEDPSLRDAMVESVLLHVLSAHRGAIDYRNAQRERRWLELPQPLASERRVGLLGLGHLGGAAAVALAGLGFPVTGWSRTPKQIAGVRCLAGDAALDALLATSDVLVCLLPQTPATTGLLNAARLARLPRGATVVNVGRGAQLDEAALLAALDAGRLGGAILDVFAVEPLPPESPLWRHERVVVFPHVAANPHPRSAAAAVASVIRAHRAQASIRRAVDPLAGY